MEKEKVARLAMHEGWDVVRSHIDKWVDSNARRLTDSNFDNLLEVGRIQGEITALRRVVSFVNTRRDKVNRGD